MTTHQLLLHPTDVLFFRDGRPMEGSSSGHGAAWPLPHILDSALHHALRRADLPEVHRHRLARNGKKLSENREEHGRTFGSLKSAGPFPVLIDAAGELWHFPRPLDAQGPGTASTHRPFLEGHELLAGSSNSLHPVINTVAPSKEKPHPWLTRAEFEAYLSDKEINPAGKKDGELFAAEHNIGIAIDPSTNTTKEGAFYSASYLRLRPETRIGLLTDCHDKKGDDLIAKAITNTGNKTHILVGGQQRTSTVTRTTPDRLPLPQGHRDRFPTAQIPGPDGLAEKHLVRWILLTPAIFPEIKGDQQKGIPPHPGGSLPTWIDPQTNELRLRTRPPRQPGQSREKWRKEVANAGFISATLVAALTGKPLPVTGWALTDIDRDTHETISTGGARSTHLAVPAGSVYYFACDSAEAAQNLADALNWHGAEQSAGEPPAVTNRRSSLLGEKGYGLGVCAPWHPHLNRSSERPAC